MEEKSNLELIAATRPKCAKQCWKALFLGNTREMHRSMCEARTISGNNNIFVVFPLRVWGKSSIFQHKRIWKYAYKYKSLHLQIIIEKETVQEEDMC